jgi:alpha-aminoadipate carrier protein LysW
MVTYALYHTDAIGESTMQVECPECGDEFTIPDDTVIGEIIVCPECGAELEVVELTPPTLALAPEVEEDWGE